MLNKKTNDNIYNSIIIGDDNIVHIREIFIIQK